MVEPTIPSSDGVPPHGRVLLVIGEGHLSTHELEPGKTIAIGRDDAADVKLDHPKVSRRHALVHGDEVAQLEDAGGTNRVHVAGSTLAPNERVPLEVGGSFQVGPYTVLLLGRPSDAGESVEGRAALAVRDVRAPTMSDLVVRVATSDVSVLVRGETGVGKEVLAQALHARSRRTGRFVAINCAALTESLLESELFGHERGAFTGAVGPKPGLFEVATRGTIFLDEIGDLPLGMQAKLLRAIETRQVTRVGGVDPIVLDVRFVSATHVDLRAAVAAKTFRQDLYYRLNGITIVVVPLRERKEAIVELAQDFLEAAAARVGRKLSLDPSALATLSRHQWPGNVRELKAVIERAVLVAPGDVVHARHIVIDDLVEPSSPAPSRGSDEERARIVAALESCAGNQTRAAKLLGISRATLATKLALLDIPRPRK